MDLGLSVSLFERLQGIGVDPLLLDTQYRMHPQLAAFSSAMFYDGRVRSAPLPADRKPPPGLMWPNPQVGAMFVDVPGEEQRAGQEAVDMGPGPLSSPSFQNQRCGRIQMRVCISSHSIW